MFVSILQDDKKKERTVQRSLSTYLNRKHSPNSPEGKDKPFRGRNPVSI